MLVLRYQGFEVDEFYAAVQKIRMAFPEIRRLESTLLSKEYKFDFMPMCYGKEK